MTETGIENGTETETGTGIETGIGIATVIVIVTGIGIEPLTKLLAAPRDGEDVLRHHHPLMKEAADALRRGKSSSLV